MMRHLTALLCAALCLSACSVVPAFSPAAPVATLPLSPAPEAQGSEASVAATSGPSPTADPASSTDLPAGDPTSPEGSVAADAAAQGQESDAATDPGAPVDEAESEAAEAAAELAADPEAQEDTRLLTAPDQAVPDEAGESVAPAEVAFDFPVVENQKVRYYIDFYTGPGREVFKRWLERSSRYVPMMQEIFAEYGLPQDLVYLAMVESGYNPKAYSWAQASGPWQFIRGTGRIFGLQDDWWHDERRDFAKSTRAAARYLKELHRIFDGNWYLAVASYNAGEGKLSRAVARYGTRDFWELSQGKYLRDETKNYVPKLLAFLLMAKQPEKYGFTDLNYQPPLQYETVQIPSTTDLEVVARFCGVSYDEIKQLNPELKRWATPPGVRDYALHVPVGTAERFMEGYATLPVSERASYAHHQVKSGDTLLGLAKRYGIRVDDIMTMNHISNPRGLKIGRNLLLPLRKGLNGPPDAAELADDYTRTKRPAGRTHTVKSGETIWKIARRYDVSERQLRVWNNLGHSSLLRPGQVLAISTASSGKKSSGKTTTAKGVKPAKAPASTVKVAKKSKAEAKLTRITYKVKRGDTLSGIARRYDVPVARIIDWNNFSTGHILQPGDRIKLLIADADRG